MKVEVRRLRGVMDLLSPAIPKTPATPILNYILFANGQAIAGDMENTVMLDFPEASNDRFLLHKDALDFLKFIPGDMMAEVSQQGGEKTRTMLISCGGSKRTCPWAKAEDYPPLAPIPIPQIHLDGDRLLEAMSLAMVYASKDDSRLPLTGVTLALDKEQSAVFAGDGYRMFHKDIPASVSDPVTVIIPSTTVLLLKDLWKKASKQSEPAVDALLSQVALSKRFISLGFDLEEKKNEGEAVNKGGLLSAQIGDVTLLSRLIPANPPAWMDVIPKDPTVKLKVFAQDLYRSLLQVREVAIQESGIIRLFWADNTLKIMARASEQVAEAESFATITGDEGYIGFNIRYLTEYLKERQGLVEMGITSPRESVRFMDGKCTVVMMPVFVKEDKPGQTSDQAAEEAQTESEGGTPETGNVTQKERDAGAAEVASPEMAKEEKEPVAATTTPAKAKKRSKPGKSGK